MLFKPGKEQSIAISFASITIITHVEQYVKMLCEKLIENGKDCRFNFSIMRRADFVNLLNDKLIRITTSYRCFLFERNRIMYATFCLKDIVVFWRQHDIIRGTLINMFEGKWFHNETIVPVMPLRAHSSAMRFSALRLISNECLKRAKASSYVTFFASMIAYLTFHAANKRNDKIKTEKQYLRNQPCYVNFSRMNDFVAFFFAEFRESCIFAGQICYC